MTLPMDNQSRILRHAFHLKSHSGLMPMEELRAQILSPAGALALLFVLRHLPPSARMSSLAQAHLLYVVQRSYNQSIVQNCPANLTNLHRSFDFATGILHNPGYHGTGGVCTSLMTSGQSVVYAAPVSNGFTPHTATFSSLATMMANPVEGYNFAAAITSSTTSPSSSGTRSSTTTSTTPTQSSTPVTKAGGLGNGAKIGIGVGVGVGVVALALIVIIAAILLRRRRRGGSPGQKVVEMAGQNGLNGGSNGYGREKGLPFASEVYGSSARSELDGRSPALEVDGRSKPVELSG